METTAGPASTMNKAGIRNRIITTVICAVLRPMASRAA
jgi:hypothetical protein